MFYLYYQPTNQRTPYMAAGGGMVYWKQALRHKRAYHKGIFGDSKVI